MLAISSPLATSQRRAPSDGVAVARDFPFGAERYGPYRIFEFYAQDSLTSNPIPEPMHYYPNVL